MTDKQIIIDGFNLEYIKELLYNGQRSAITTNIFEAIIEELECKEQECENLALENYELNELLDQLKAQLLDQEAETLKAGGIISKYKQTLTEIKEIAEYDFKALMNAEDYHNMTEVLQQILQKISEVTNEQS